MLKTTDELALKFIPGFKIQIKIQIKLFFSLFIFFCMSERITTFYFFLLGKDGFENFIIFFLKLGKLQLKFDQREASRSAKENYTLSSIR